MTDVLFVRSCFEGSCQIVFQSNCEFLCFKQQWMRAFYCSVSVQQSELLILGILDITVSILSYVVLICTSPILNDFDNLFHMLICQRFISFREVPIKMFLQLLKNYLFSHGCASDTSSWLKIPLQICCFSLWLALVDLNYAFS